MNYLHHPYLLLWLFEAVIYYFWNQNVALNPLQRTIVRFALPRRFHLQQARQPKHGRAVLSGRSIHPFQYDFYIGLRAMQISRAIETCEV
jgi:hypothetical protein